MTVADGPPEEPEPPPRAERPRHRATHIAIAVAVLALVALLAPLHQQVTSLLQAAQPTIAAHPVAGPVLFVALAALSAMLVFFSSLLLVPVGVVAWGEVACAAMLWAGWFLGGVLTYSIGRYLGRPAVDRLVSPEKIARYEARIPHQRSFATALLIQLVVPSDIAGYFLGLSGYRLGRYLAALAIAELPYVLGTVYVGAAFVERQYVVLIVAAAVVLVALAWLRLRRRSRPV